MCDQGDGDQCDQRMSDRAMTDSTLKVAAEPGQKATRQRLGCVEIGQQREQERQCGHWAWRSCEHSD